MPCYPDVQAGHTITNQFTFYSFDNGAATKPYLSVTYNEPAVQHVITTVPAGLSVTVDGNACTAPCTLYWTPGANHTIATTTPQDQAGGVAQKAFSAWSDGGAISHSITASSQPATYTATFIQQYWLATSVLPVGSGWINPGSGWFNSGTVVQVSAGAGPGYVFAFFSGALSGSTNPQPLTMDTWKSVIANFTAEAVQHVITTAPTGLSLTVDGAGCTSPCSFQWTAGSTHTIATMASQAGPPGTQYVFAGWSDGGAISHTITASSTPQTYTASFTTQYFLTTAASPPAGGTITPASGLYNAGTVVTVAATPNAGYQFAGFSGDLSGTTTPQNLTMNAPKTVTATFTGSGVQHVVTTAPAGLSVTVDGGPCTSPCTFQWMPGTTHTIATTATQAGPPGTQYVFASWSDGGALSHTITASSTPATYTTSFNTQYYLTTAASPPEGGTISPSSGWYNAGTVVTVAATANAGYVFSGFSGDLGGTTTPQNLTMGGPKSVTAIFSGATVQHVITTAPAGLSLTVDAAPCTSPCTFFWTPGGNHTISTTTPQSGSPGTQYVFANWSDGGAISHTITASSSPASYTASFTTQYYLTTAASPTGWGTISPASGWHNSGAVISVSATANAGYQFSGFSRDLSGTTTPQSLTMNAPKNVTANFAVANSPPTVTSLTPTSGGGATQTFTAVYSDAGGAADISDAYVLVHTTSGNTVNACYVRLQRSPEGVYLLYLRDDASASWSPPVAVGQATVSQSTLAQNSQCVVRGSVSSAAALGNTLSLNIRLDFKKQFQGYKKVYLKADDFGGLTSGWQQPGGATFQASGLSIVGPSALEANIGYIPLDRYRETNANQWVPSCLPGQTVRQCYQNALSSYHSQGAVGVRFYFNICGTAQNTALDGCGTGSVTVNEAWMTNAGFFLDDVRAAQIYYITINPLLDGGPTGYLYCDSSSQDPRCQNVRDCQGAPLARPIVFEAAIPWGYEQGAATPDPSTWDKHSPEPYVNPWGNDSWACAPKNPIFIGWDKIVGQQGVLDRLVSMAQAKDPLVVREVELQGELHIDSFPVMARAMVDPVHRRADDTDYEVYQDVRDLMSRWEYDPAGVTYSIAEERVIGPPDDESATFDCILPFPTGSPGTSARLVKAYQIYEALSGRFFGNLTGSTNHGLWCQGFSSLVAPEARLPYSYPPPGIFDLHSYPCIGGASGCTGGQTPDHIQAYSRQTFDASKEFIDRYYSGALFMLGETAPTDVTPAGTSCVGDGAPGFAPFSMVQGFNASTLHGHAPGVIFRPFCYAAECLQIGGVGDCVNKCWSFPQALLPPYQPTP